MPEKKSFMRPLVDIGILDETGSISLVLTWQARPKLFHTEVAFSGDGAAS